MPIRVLFARVRRNSSIVGSTYAELMPLFEADPETKAIVIYSEPGGPMEAQLADHMREMNSRLPVVAFMAGRFMDAMPGMRFGHAGTIVEGRADTAAEKIRLALERLTFNFGGKASRVTASFGVAEFPAEASAAGQLVRVADERLFRAKQAGRNRVVAS